VQANEGRGDRDYYSLIQAATNLVGISSSIYGNKL